MNIILSEYSGFCFGVKKAVATAYSTADNNKTKVYSYGPLIHNNDVVNELKLKGINPIYTLEALKENDTVIIRSHGVSKNVIESLKQNNINIIDATCPYVNNIHKIVEEYYNKGYKIVIIGDPLHPEIEGTNGWCENNAIIINSEDEARALNKFSKTCIVSQTTISISKWKSIINLLLDASREIVIFNTICDATYKRQTAAIEMSKKCDAVIVLGGLNSSNTIKLFEICKSFCNKTYHIENINSLNLENIKNVKNLGITAGASTPDWIIKEAIEIMNNLENTNEENLKNEENSIEENVDVQEDDNQLNFMDEYVKTFKTIHSKDIIKGKVISVTDNEVMVNIGYKADGIIPKSEFSYDESINAKDILKEGDEIDVYVININDGEGNVLLSKKMIEKEKNLEFVEECFKNNTIVSVKVINITKGGIIASLKGVNVFIPASLVSNKYTDDLNKYSGKTLDIKIIEFNLENRKIIGSRRIVLKEEAIKGKKELLNKLEAGQTVKGKVSRLTNFGAFVDIGGIDGLIHISELAWTRVNKPSDILKEGDNVEVYILSLDKEKEKVSLSLKKTLPEPWKIIEQKYKVGDIIEGKVLRIAPFGAFIEIIEGVDGLVHISQISDSHVKKVEDVLKISEIVKAKILAIDINEKKISLSIKDLNEPSSEEVSSENEPSSEEVSL